MIGFALCVRHDSKWIEITAVYMCAYHTMHLGYTTTPCMTASCRMCLNSYLCEYVRIGVILCVRYYVPSVNCVHYNHSILVIPRATVQCMAHFVCTSKTRRRIHYDLSGIKEIFSSAYNFQLFPWGWQQNFINSFMIYRD